MPNYTIAVKRVDNDETVDTIGNAADKSTLLLAERGININISDEYYTEIVEIEAS